MLLYTDWSCHGNPWKGWCGFILVAQDGTITTGWWSRSHTTNNQMELCWVILWLQAAIRMWDSDVQVVTDSKYILTWVREFADRKSRWMKTKSKTPVKNSKMWLLLMEKITPQLQIEWWRTKWHANNKYNNLCDKLANEFTASQSQPLPESLFDQPAQNSFPTLF